MTVQFVNSEPQSKNWRDTPAARYGRAMRTLARPAQVHKNDGGSTPRQRTAARFALLALMAGSELSSEERKDVYGAFEHAYKAFDIAPELHEAILRERPALDFSAKCQPKKADAETRTNARAEAERRSNARKERDRADRAARKGPSGGSSKGRGK